MSLITLAQAKAHLRIDTVSVSPIAADEADLILRWWRPSTSSWTI